MKKIITAAMIAVIAMGTVAADVYADDSKYIQIALEKAKHDFEGLEGWGAYDYEGQPMHIFDDMSQTITENAEYSLIAVHNNSAAALICLVDKRTDTCVYIRGAQDWWPEMLEDIILPAYRSMPFRIVIDGRELLNDTEGYIENGTTMLPMRAIFERLGAEVEWYEDTKRIVATRGEDAISMRIGSKTAAVNGQETTLSVAPVIQNYSTLVPARFVSEALGAQVSWDAATKTVTINS